MADFKALKNRQSKSLRQQLADTRPATREEVDPRILEPDWKQLAEGEELVVRFLVAKEGPNIIKRSQHFIQHNGNYFVNWCIYNTPEKHKCPACAYANNAYNNEDKKTGGNFGAQHTYFVNAYIITCSYNEEVEGTVRIIPFKKQIFKELDAFMASTGKYSKNPEKFAQFAYEDGSFDPLNPFSGADFIYNVTLKTIGRNTGPSYDGCRFDKPSVLCGFSEDVIEEIYNNTHDLSFLTPETLSPEEFSAKFEKFVYAEEKTFAPQQPKEVPAVPKFTNTAAPTLEEEEEETPKPKNISNPKFRSSPVNDRLSKFMDVELEE